MRKYVCIICGFIYDEAVGIPEAGIAAGTKWEDLPEDWTCPLCGATKDEFEEMKTGPAKEEQPIATEEDHDDHELRELTFAEMAALCSNLSKGFEKQYKSEEAELFKKLSDYYDEKFDEAEGEQLEDLMALIEQDLNIEYPKASAVAIDKEDRGALRALVWSEKVSKMLLSLIRRYEKEQGGPIEKTNVYVCEICGFVYVGDEAPEVCPVCKVPNMKITQVKRR